MCKGKLQTNLASRISIDPVSGKQVDKATSVVAAANNVMSIILKMKRI